MGEVVTALDMLRPLESMIRNVRFEPIFVTSAFREEGRKRVTVRIFLAARSATSSRKRKACLKQ
jgi:hypothetical protein